MEKIMLRNPKWLAFGGLACLLMSGVAYIQTGIVDYGAVSAGLVCFSFLASNK